MLSIDIREIDIETFLSFADENISNYEDFDIEIKFKSDYSQSKLIRSFIQHIFDRNWLESLWKNRFCLISDELVNNSIEYWSATWDLNSFIIRVRKSDDKTEIFFEVEDTWKWNFPKSSAEMEAIRSQKLEKWFQNYLWKRWRWLFQLVTNMVDNLYFKDAPSWWLIVWIQKKL